MSLPKISVVIPSFNQAQFIERSLISVLSQNYKGEIELIVSDGGSNDGTSDILKKYDDRIIWWSEKDRGYAHAVQKGFEAATGELFAIQSSDDYYLQNAFKNLVDKIISNPDSSLACGKEVIENESGRIFSGYDIPAEISPESFLLDHKFPGIFQHTTLFKKEIYFESGGISEKFDICADADLFYRILHFGKGYFVNEYTAVYQKHEDQRTVKYASKFREQMINMVDYCRKTDRFNKRFQLSEAKFEEYKSFINLFYLQYDNPEKARQMAGEIRTREGLDKRTLELADQILKPPIHSKNTDNILKKNLRRSKRIWNKYILRKPVYSQTPKKSFSEEINASWWKTRL